MLASSSGVSSERAAFMQLVRAEIERVNKQLGKRGSVSMVFQKGSLLVRLQSPRHDPTLTLPPALCGRHPDPTLTLTPRGAAGQVERPAELEEVVGQKRLADRVTGILSRIEEELDHVDARIGAAMHVLDADNDGLARALHPNLPCPRSLRRAALGTLAARPLGPLGRRDLIEKAHVPANPKSYPTLARR